MSSSPHHPNRDLAPESSSKHGEASGEDHGQGKRAHRRFRWRGRMEIAWLTESGIHETRIVDSLDLGLGGMGIVSPEERQVGDVGAALVLDSGEAGALRFYEVVHCRADESVGGYLVGARWIECPEWADAICVKHTPCGLRLSVRSHARRDDGSAGQRGAA